MGVSPKERKALSKMWNNARAAGSEVPDDNYGFKITKAKPKISENGGISIVMHNKVVDAKNQDYVGEELITRDNLGTEENIAWFKRKLHRLGFSEDEMPSDIDEVLDESDSGLCAKLVGIVFEGATRFKNDFQNVYVNKLISRDSEEEEGEDEGAEEEEGEEEAADLEEGDAVSFTLKGVDYEGTILELLDNDKVRVETEEGKKYRVSVDILEPIFEDGEEGEEEDGEEEGAEEEEGEEDGSAEEEAEEEGEEEEAAEEEAEEEEEGFPERAEFEDMKLPELKKVLKSFDFAPTKLAAPREFATCLAGLVYEPRFKPSPSQLKAACAGLGVKAKRGDAKATVVALRKAAKKAFE